MTALYNVNSLTLNDCRSQQRIIKIDFCYIYNFVTYSKYFENILIFNSPKVFL